MRNLKVPAELARLFPELCEITGCHDWAMTRGHLTRRDCAIYFLGSSAFRIPKVVIKVLRNATGRNKARDIHRKSLPFFQAATAAFTVPEPLFPLGGGDALAMEWIDAPLCGARLAKGFHRRATREAVLRGAGSWLGWFHSLNQVASEPFEALAAFRKIELIVEKIRELDADGLARDHWLEDYVKLAETCARSIDGVALPHVRGHGDFTPFNCFIRGGTMIGFDYQVKRRFPVAHDICRFLVYLDVHRLLPASAAELRESGCRASDLAIFMEGYGTPGPPAEKTLWLKLHFLELMRRIASLRLTRAKGRKRPFRMQEMARLRRNARTISSVLH